MSLFAAEDGYSLPSPSDAELAKFLVDSGMDLGSTVEWLRAEDRSLPDYDDFFEDEE
jgi:hypothetical protein